MKRVLLLGASGSIGKNTIEVIKKHPDEFILCGAHCHTNKPFLEKLKQEFKLKSIALSKNEDKELYTRLIEDSKPDIIVNAIASSAGLQASFDSLRLGIDLALANKESLVMAGDILKEEAKKRTANILPIDSEHWGLFSLLEGKEKSFVKRLWLTASGGPFLHKPLDEFKDISLNQALSHPTWKMGKKISIDSATMANKGLELIEAVKLFDIEPEKIEVVIQPSSHVHALIQTIDGSFYAQLSNPTMKVPILNALSYPTIIESDVGQLDFSNLSLNFLLVQKERYPLLWLAREALTIGNWGVLAYNAANEAAVEAFILGKIAFPHIYKVVEHIIYNQKRVELISIDSIIEEHSAIYESTISYIAKKNWIY